MTLPIIELAGGDSGPAVIDVHEAASATPRGAGGKRRRVAEPGDAAESAEGEEFTARDPVDFEALLALQDDRFQSFEELLARLQSVVQACGFGVSIIRSNNNDEILGKTRYILGCERRGSPPKSKAPLSPGKKPRVKPSRKCGCLWEATASRPKSKSREKDTRWRLTINHSTHNHVLDPTAEYIPANRRFKRTKEVVETVHRMLENPDLNCGDIAASITATCGIGITPKDVDNMAQGRRRAINGLQGADQTFLGNLPDSSVHDQRRHDDPRGTQTPRGTRTPRGTQTSQGRGSQSGRAGGTAGAARKAGKVGADAQMAAEMADLRKQVAQLQAMVTQLVPSTIGVTPTPAPPPVAFQQIHAAYTTSTWTVDGLYQGQGLPPSQGQGLPPAQGQYQGLSPSQGQYQGQGLPPSQA